MPENLALWKELVFALRLAILFLKQKVGAYLKDYLITGQMKVNRSDNSGRAHVV